MGFAIKNYLLPNLTETPNCTMPLSSLLTQYAPTHPSEDTVKDCFYEELGEALHKVLKSHKILLLGDFNARVRKNSVVWKGIITTSAIPVQTG